MNTKEKIAVCSRSFSKNSILRNCLLEKYKFVTFNDEGINLTGDKLIKFLAGHDKAIIGLETVDENLLSRNTKLKVISKYGVGLDNIDIDAMTESVVSGSNHHFDLFGRNTFEIGDGLDFRIPRPFQGIFSVETVNPVFGCAFLT